MSDLRDLFGINWFILLAGIAAFGLGILPVCHHLIFGLRERRTEILSYFNKDSIVRYYKQFYYAELEELLKKKDGEVFVEFAQMYDKRFGVRTFHSNDSAGNPR